MFASRVRSALLVDFDNVHITLKDRGRDDFAGRIAQWTAWLEDGAFDPRGRGRKFVAKRVYWNGHFDVHREASEAAGFDAFACRGQTASKKSSADIVITLDAIEILTEYPGVREVVLLSMDTDFVPVVNRLQAKGLAVAAMGNEENSSAVVYRDHADYVIRLGDFRRALDYERAPRTWFGLRAAPTGEAAPAPEPAPVLTRAPVHQAPRPSQQRRAPTRAQPNFDIPGSAEIIAAAAAQSPGSPISRETVLRVLRSVEGFATGGAHPWLGCGSYRNLVLALAQHRPSELRVKTYNNGGVSLVYGAT